MWDRYWFGLILQRGRKWVIHRERVDSEGKGDLRTSVGQGGSSEGWAS